MLHCPPKTKTIFIYLNLFLLGPLPIDVDDLPIAEPVANPPEETLTLNLAGLTLPKFLEVKEQFRELIADMAKVYIRDNNITLGLNTT